MLFCTTVYLIVSSIPSFFLDHHVPTLEQKLYLEIAKNRPVFQVPLRSAKQMRIERSSSKVRTCYPGGRLRDRLASDSAPYYRAAPKDVLSFY